MPHKLALIGFGTVGQGLAEILRDKGDLLRRNLGFDGQVVAVTTLSRGAIYHPDGLDLQRLLESVRHGGTLDNYPTSPGLERDWDSLRTIRDCNADTVVEVSFTDIETGQPAIDHCRAAFKRGKNVVTANKGPLALAYAELSGLAREQGVRWAFEGTVMSGTPALRVPPVTLAGNDIAEIRGIFNGTTNYILTRMEDGLSFAAALKEAQDLGYAEADPTADVEGFDALAKVVILANVVMNLPLSSEQVACQGISHLTSADIGRAKDEGKRWKLIGRVSKANGQLVASVGPEMVSLADPLANVMGALNAITYECDLAGPITLVGSGAGRKETGFSILIDLINIQRGLL
jgi:homoserine dehydrogenase